MSVKITIVDLQNENAENIRILSLYEKNITKNVGVRVHPAFGLVFLREWFTNYQQSRSANI